MRVIDHRQFAKKAAQKRHWKRPLLIGGAAVIGLFVAANLVMMAVYHGRVYPNYSLGAMPVGGKSYKSLTGQVSADALLPKTVTLKKGDKTQTQTPAQLGLHVDTPGSIKSLKQSRAWLPILTLFMHHTADLKLRLDSSAYNSAISQTAQNFSKQPVKNHIEFNGQDFFVADAQGGYSLNEPAFKNDLLKAMQAGKANMTVPTNAIKAPAADDLSGELASLKKQITTKLSFAYQGQASTPSAAVIGSWYVSSGQTMAPSQERIGAYLDTIAANAANRGDLAVAANYALGKNQPLNLAVVSASGVVRKYCTASRGASSADINQVIGKLAAVYADARGWNNGGRLAFQHVDSGCEFTVWLSSPGQMASFGSICDSYYNCRVGSSVVLNEDRWLSATAPWNAAGRSLEDYHVLMINHETGHFLGFPDNPVCPASGSLAPVMMQQSVDLKGCVFNPWPLPAELVEPG